MNSRPRSFVRTWKTKRGSLNRQRKTSLSRCQRRLRNVGNGRKVKLDISAKLEALKNLIPARNGEIKADRLFEETADYIVFLKAQVEILQGLNDYYGSDDKKEVV
ncbi:hypothetical protein NE237_008124 [Protea cynaroides]|uniref:Uncharacterized protein n=1 Tax=Protea cynaroides TaxID=273540 RepID=A0A9Q0QWS5_9MAGN|nr:hypothetical protein NE237_008124 [Protea cynaroides]